MFPREYDGSTVKEWAGDSQFRAWRADLARYRKWGYTAWGSEGFWALTVYRAQRGLLPYKERAWAKAPRAGLALAKKLLSVVTHINLDVEAEIGPGMLIPHSGPVRVHAEAKIGADCALHHVVTIGAGTRPGAAQIGDHVMVGCHAAILGPVRIGDCAMVGASSLVLSDVPAYATAVGVPARVVTPQQEQTPRTHAASSVPALLRGEPLDGPLTNAFEALRQNARARPDARALSYVDEHGAAVHLSYAALFAAACRARAHLTHTLAEDEPVLILARRTPDTVALMLGAIGAERAFSCINPRWRWPQLSRVLARTGAHHLFVDGASAQALAGASDDARQRLVLCEVASAARWGGQASTGPSETSRERVGAILFTSGSSGEPKGVCISSHDLAARARAEVHWFGLGQRDVLLNLLPFSFDVGLNLLLAAISAGAACVVSESWLPRDVLAAAERYEVTGIPCVPSIWQDFIHLELAFDTRHAHRSLRFITLSGGDLAPALRAQLGKVAPGVSVFKTYGQTEAFRATSLRPELFAAHGESVGVPFPGVTVCVVRKDGSLAVRGEVGELVHAGLGVMMRYLGEPARSDAKLRPSPCDPDALAIYTGDNAFIDDAGFVHVVGRDDEMLKLNGNRVYPSEVRSALCELPGVRDAIVLGERGRSGEPLLFAFVSTREATSASELTRAARALLPGYMVPAHILVKDELPRTASGKPDGEALRAEARALLSADGVGRDTGREAPLPFLVEVVERQIVEFVRARVDAAFDPRVHALAGLLDSIVLIELAQALEAGLGLPVAIARLSSAAMASSESLARAILAEAAPHAPLRAVG
jgi:serine O-acetyltransferase